MKTLQRALEVIAGASIALYIAKVDLITGGVLISLALIIYLPIAAQFDGDSNGN